MSEKKESKKEFKPFSYYPSKIYNNININNPIQEKPLDSHPAEYEEIFQELNRSLNEIDGL